MDPKKFAQNRYTPIEPPCSMAHQDKVLNGRIGLRDILGRREGKGKGNQILIPHAVLGSQFKELEKARCHGSP